MSNAIFPTLPGLSWPVIKTPEWTTGIQKTASGRELRASYSSYPRWRIRLGFEVLSQTDLASLAGFFNARRGSFDNFLFFDQVDNSVANQVFAVGDGQSTQFQLVRNYGGVTEPVLAVVGTPVIKVNGVITAVSIDSNAVVTFSTAPAAGATLSWSGQYYFRVRFTQDSSDFEQFMSNLWCLKKLEFITEKA